MQENNNPKGDSTKGDENGKRAPHTWLRWIFVAGGVFFVALLIGSIFIPNLTERVKFFTANVLSLSVLVAIIVQAYIYRRQWEMMREQRNTMNDQLAVMRASEDTLKRQADAFEAQVDVMNGQLEAMRRQQDQNERAIKTAEDGVAVSREAFYIGEAPYFGATKIVFRWATTMTNTGTGAVQHETGQPELIITFMNGGKTPAWHFLCTPHLELRERAGEEGKWVPLNAVHDGECPDAENSFYPSGAQKCIKYRGRGEFGEFSPREIEAINARTQTLFLIIELGYTDMRDDRQTRNWIRCLNPTTGRFGDCGASQD